MQSISDSFFKLAIIVALFSCAYSISTYRSAGIDFESMADYLVDSGFNFPESQQELELLEQRKILISTSINAHSSRSIIQKLLILNARDADAPIDLYLRTEGGWEADAFSVINTMRATTAPVNIHAIGEVHSAGLMILTAATGQRIAYPQTIFGYHALEEGELPEWVKRYEQLWGINSKLPKDWIAPRDGEMLYFTAEEALTYGVVDKLMEAKPSR